jgi:hypothetical protein
VAANPPAAVLDSPEALAEAGPEVAVVAVWDE